MSDTPMRRRHSKRLSPSDASAAEALGRLAAAPGAERSPAPVQADAASALSGASGQPLQADAAGNAADATPATIQLDFEAAPSAAAQQHESEEKGVDEVEEEVEQLVDVRTRAHKKEYLVRWQGHGPEEDTWEPEEELARGCAQLLRDFQGRRSTSRARSARASSKPDANGGAVDADADSDDAEKVIDCVVRCRKGAEGQREYLTRWKDLPEDSWESADTFISSDCRALLRYFNGDVPSSPPPERIRLLYPPDDSGLHVDSDGNYELEPEGKDEAPVGMLTPSRPDYAPADDSALAHRRRSVIQLDPYVDWRACCDPSLPSPTPSEEIEQDPHFSVADGTRRDYHSQESDIDEMEDKLEDLQVYWEEYNEEEIKEFLANDAGVFASANFVDELACDLKDKRLAYHRARGLPSLLNMDAAEGTVCTQPRRASSKAWAERRTEDVPEGEAAVGSVGPMCATAVCVWVCHRVT